MINPTLLFRPDQVPAVCRWRGVVKPGHVNLLRFAKVKELDSFDSRPWRKLDDVSFRGNRIVADAPHSVPKTIDQLSKSLPDANVFLENLLVGSTPVLVPMRAHVPFGALRKYGVDRAGNLFELPLFEMPTKEPPMGMVARVTTDCEARVALYVFGQMVVA